MARWFSRRWQGQVPAARLWWRDMLLLGTVLNLCAGFAALMVYAQGAGMTWAMVLHFATLPFNAFLFMCLWRRPERTGLQVALASMWFAAMVIV